MNKNTVFIQPIWKNSHWPGIQKFLNKKGSGKLFNEIAQVQPTKKFIPYKQYYLACGVKKKGGICLCR